jgi:hypothetical protein
MGQMFSPSRGCWSSCANETMLSRRREVDRWIVLRNKRAFNSSRSSCPSLFLSPLRTTSKKKTHTTLKIQCQRPCLLMVSYQHTVSKQAAYGSWNVTLCQVSALHSPDSFLQHPSRDFWRYTTRPALSSSNLNFSKSQVPTWTSQNLTLKRQIWNSVTTNR